MNFPSLVPSLLLLSMCGLNFPSLLSHFVWRISFSCKFIFNASLLATETLMFCFFLKIVFVCVIYVCTCTYVRVFRGQVHFQCLPQSLFILFFETGFLWTWSWALCLLLHLSLRTVMESFLVQSWGHWVQPNFELILFFFCLPHHIQFVLPTSNFST